MRGARRRQDGGLVARIRKDRGETTRSSTVKGDVGQVRRKALEARESVHPRIGDGCVEAACPIAGREHVPQADSMGQQAREAPFVWLPVQRLAEQIAQQAPELIARVRVVLARRQRSLGRKAAENKARDPPVDDRRETLQARRPANGRPRAACRSAASRTRPDRPAARPRPAPPGLPAAPASPSRALAPTRRGAAAPADDAG